MNATPAGCCDDEDDDEEEDGEAADMEGSHVSLVKWLGGFFGPVMSLTACDLAICCLFRI